MIKPYFFGWFRSFTSRCWKWIRCATPAFSALRRAVLSTSGSASYPWISVSISSEIVSCASLTASYHIFFAVRFVQSSAVNDRFIPGAMLAAIIAASMGNVPLPQNGSTRILSLLHGVSMISAAARFSAMGAFPAAGRYPLLCRDAPVVSIPTVTMSFIRNTLTG